MAESWKIHFVSAKFVAVQSQQFMNTTAQARHNNMSTVK